MKVELDYFKVRGKWYANGSYETNKEHLFQIWEEVEEMLKQGKRPGLIDGHSDFHVLIQVPSHTFNLLHLLPFAA